MAKYRKRPVIIDAVQFTGTGKNCEMVAQFLGGYGGEVAAWKSCTYEGGFILTLEGEMKFGPGDWIIKGVAGEFYPIKDSIFTVTYEEA